MQTAELNAAHAGKDPVCAAVFVSLELSRSSWLVTVLAAPLGPKMSRHQLQGGDLRGLIARFSERREAVRRRTGQVVPVIVIQEAGLDGFWIHRALVAEGIESHVVDPASIAVSRRHRRAKTDRIDGEALMRTLMAWKRGEPRVCSMVRVPTPQEEDRRRLCRELKSLVGERIRHVNRVKGLFFAQGIGGYEPKNKDRRERLKELRTRAVHRGRTAPAAPSQGAGSARARDHRASEPADRCREGRARCAARGGSHRRIGAGPGADAPRTQRYWSRLR